MCLLLLGKVWSWEKDAVSLLTENYQNTVKIYIAKYFYVALTDNGQVYRWQVESCLQFLTVFANFGIPSRIFFIKNSNLGVTIFLLYLVSLDLNFHTFHTFCNNHNTARKPLDTVVGF